MRYAIKTVLEWPSLDGDVSATLPDVVRCTVPSRWNLLTPDPFERNDFPNPWAPIRAASLSEHIGKVSGASFEFS